MKMPKTTRRDFTVGGLSAMAFGSLLDANAADTPELAASKKWFREAQYGMMAHWGLYSILGGEWKGRLMGQQYIAEWAQQYFRIPNAEYSRLATAFNPILFDADEWARIAADAGMKYLVFTSKHHDGFAMFRSKASRFNVVDATPVTTNDSWGYKPTDQNWKSPERIRRDREHLRSIGANYLLNIGPDPFGRLPVSAVKAVLAAR